MNDPLDDRMPCKTPDCRRHVDFVRRELGLDICFACSVGDIRKISEAERIARQRFLLAFGEKE
jgi:hypothetical protein